MAMEQIKLEIAINKGIVTDKILHRGDIAYYSGFRVEIDGDSELENSLQYRVYNCFKLRYLVILDRQ
jgi:hypothetical protein